MKIRKNVPEKKLVINVPDSMQRLSTLDLIKRAVSIWLDRRAYKKKELVDPANGMPNMTNWTNVATFAIVVDGDVMDVMRVTPKMRNILQSEPQFILIDNSNPDGIRPGYVYKDGKFLDPNINLEIAPQAFNLKEKTNEK